MLNAARRAYYGWNVAALLLLLGSAAWLGKKGFIGAAKFVAVLAGITFAITCILRYACHVCCVAAAINGINWPRS